MMPDLPERHLKPGRWLMKESAPARSIKHVKDLDVAIFYWFNGQAGYHPAFDALVTFFTQAAPEIFAIMFGWYFLRPGPERNQTRRTIWLSGLSGILAVALSLVLHHFVYRARPFDTLPLGQVYTLVPEGPDSSFPSDHTMGSAAFAAGMWRSPARYSFAVVALLVGASRIVAGVHWPSDVAVSFVLGSTVGWVVVRLGL